MLRETNLFIQNKVKDDWNVDCSSFQRKESLHDMKSSQKNNFISTYIILERRF